MEKIRRHSHYEVESLPEGTLTITDQLPEFLMWRLKARTLTDVITAFDTVCCELELQYVLRHHGTLDHTFTNDGMVSALEDVLLDQPQNFYPLLRSSRLNLGNEIFVLIIRNVQRRDNNEHDRLNKGIIQMLEVMHAHLT